MNRGNFVKKEKIYSLTVKGDNTLWGEAEKVN